MSPFTTFLVLAFVGKGQLYFLDTEAGKDNRNSEDRQSTSNCECGIKNKPAVEERIVGGEPTFAHEYPWLVRIINNEAKRNRNSTDIYEYMCAGSVINNRYIITAAHCTFGAFKRPLHQTAINDIELILSDYNMNVEEEMEIQGQIEKITPHHEFHTNYFDNDIALIKLSQPIQFSNKMRAVCLPDNEIALMNLENHSVKAIGWGRTSDGGPGSPIPRKVDLTIRNSQKCSTEYIAMFSGPKRTPKIPSATILCAGEYGVSGIDTCNADSGGPIMLERNGRLVAVGITSFGGPCGKQLPGIYTDVRKYITWINDNMADVGTCN